MEEVNGLSPFSIEMDSPDDLINLIEDFILPPKRDLQDNPKNGNSTNPSDNGDSKKDYDPNHTCNIIPGFKKNIQSLDLDKYKDHESIDSSNADKNHD